MPTALPVIASPEQAFPKSKEGGLLNCTIRSSEEFTTKWRRNDVHREVLSSQRVDVRERWIMLSSQDSL